MGHAGAGSRALSHTRNESHSEQLRFWPQKLSVMMLVALPFSGHRLPICKLRTQWTSTLYLASTTSQTPRKEGTLCTQWHQLTHSVSDPGSGKDSGGRGISRVLPERRWRTHALSSFSAPVKETLTTQKRLEGGQEGSSRNRPAVPETQVPGFPRGSAHLCSFVLCCNVHICIYANHIFVCLCIWISILFCVCLLLTRFNSNSMCPCICVCPCVFLGIHSSPSDYISYTHLFIPDIYRVPIICYVLS